jgi:CHAT domain-containing protein
LVVASTTAESGVPWLRALPSAAIEAAAITGTYGSSRQIASDTIDKAELFDAYRTADIVHFAGHAVANDAMPAMSALLLGGTPARFLYAYELTSLPDSSGKIIILSACDTAAGRAKAGMGANSLARPFLEAGASTVVAAAEPLDDRSAARFFIDFHRRLVASGDAIGSLRETQLSAIHRQEPLSNWSVVVALASTSVLLEPPPKE